MPLRMFRITAYWVFAVCIMFKSILQELEIKNTAKSASSQNVEQDCQRGAFTVQTNDDKFRVSVYGQKTGNCNTMTMYWIYGNSKYCC